MQQVRRIKWASRAVHKKAAEAARAKGQLPDKIRTFEARETQLKELGAQFQKALAANPTNESAQNSLAYNNELLQETRRRLSQLRAASR
ncbi:MAG: hypothetical protein PHD95_07235 [Candidatus ainarchaeum sp.]|nr:hypothetical protein [Candidatus ainarchaeum sp.]